ncbi:MAG: TlyA family RNA methyltransferase [Dehalococcoidia bacterium]|nr:TlyA family RNA methyltransferase [Dehalococcoidia bacterium]
MTHQKNEKGSYVSRGGVKLEGVLDAFGLNPDGLVCLDVGASTGGFTDCLLQRGAERVYAVDVGYGQLAWSLRNDSRVIVMERQNARHPLGIEELISFAVADVSFISLRLVLPSIIETLAPGGSILALVKPQFEAGRKEVGRGGVVKSPVARANAIGSVALWAIENGLRILGVRESPLTGPKGNHEYFLLLQKP